VASMSSARVARASDTALDLLGEATQLLRDDEAALVRLNAARDRLGEPLRVALAGKVKAGKSTLLNAFLGEQVAPTDTGECTKVVTWYRHGSIPKVTVVPRSGRPLPQPVRRVRGRLALTTADLPPQDVERIDVRWPSPALQQLVLVDTPGLASLSEELSRQSTAALTPDGGGAPAVDAVVYLMRHLHASDADFLEAFRDQQAMANQPAMTLAVLSRADEVGAGRIDALLSAGRVADRYRADPAVRALCLDVVPVAGLLAESSRTLRQVEFEALRELSTLDRAPRESLLLSADRFVSTPLEDRPAAGPQIRRVLIERFGVFGIRLAIVLIRDGYATGSDLADELVRRSGMGEVSRILTTQFAARADALKARSALITLRHELTRHVGEATPGAAELATRVEVRLRSHHDVEELGLITTLHTDPPPELADGLAAEAEVILGGAGTSAADRLRRSPDVDPDTLRADALGGVQRWRLVQSDPVSGEATRNLCRVVIRSLEGILVELDPERRSA